MSENNQEISEKKSSRRLRHQFTQHKVKLRENKSMSDLDSYLNEDILVLDQKEWFDTLK